MKNKKEKTYSFIELFAGIGGFRIAFEKHDFECKFASEIDDFAKTTYAANFGEVPHGDITKIDEDAIPTHDVLTAGFPCQAFSTAGLRKGFADSRGTMFFEIERILKKTRPKCFLLENVVGLLSHDDKKTFTSILEILKKLEYQVFYKVLSALDFNTPQNRKRVFIVGFDKTRYKKRKIDDVFFWPEPLKLKKNVGDILQSESELQKLAEINERDKYTISDVAWSYQKAKKEKAKAKGFAYKLLTKASLYSPTILATYQKSGNTYIEQQNKNPRKFTPREVARLQAFPENFVLDKVSHCQIYKQLGNAVCVNVVAAIADKIKAALNTLEAS